MAIFLAIGILENSLPVAELYTLYPRRCTFRVPTL